MKHSQSEAVSEIPGVSPDVTLSGPSTVISSFGIDIASNVDISQCHMIESVKENLEGFTD